jgi:threonine dehydrogenase-like Zn-dependent dehydrogenase
VHSQYVGAGGAQAPRLRVPLAEGTLVATPDLPSADLIPSLLATSDVLGTGWFGADAANVQPGKTVAVVGDGAVGLCAFIAAKQLGAERIIAMSRHEARQKLALEFGATDLVTERGDEGVAAVRPEKRRRSKMQYATLGRTGLQARQLGIGEATVYRILAVAKE